MTTKEFMEAYNGSPYSLEEIANIATEIDDNDDLQNAALDFIEADDNDDLQNAALDFIEATDRLEEALEDIEFEFG